MVPAASFTAALAAIVAVAVTVVHTVVWGLWSLIGG